MTDSQNFEKIQEWIRDSHKRDLRRPWVFDSFQPGASAEETYELCESRETIAYMNKEKPYPKAIKDAINEARERVYLGSLPLMKSFYCIVDAQVHIWKMNSDNDSDEIKPEVLGKDRKDGVTVVACGRALRSVLCKEWHYVLVVARGFSIQIYPVSEKGEILQDCVSMDWTDVLGGTITALTVTDDGIIYAGTGTGKVIRIVYDIEDNRPVPRKDVIKKGRFMKAILNSVRSFSPVVKIVVVTVRKETSKVYIAALHADSQIHFMIDEMGFGTWRPNGESLWKRVWNFTGLGDSERQRGEKIVTIQGLSTDNDRYVQFVAFTNNGDRLFFVPDEDRDMLMPKRREAPVEISSFEKTSREVVDAVICLSATILVFRKHIIIIRRGDSVNDVSMKEDIAIWDVEHDRTQNLGFLEPCVCYSRDSTAYCTMWKHQVIWQHLVQENPIGYIIANTGIRAMKISTPADRLMDIIDKNGGDPIKVRKDWGIRGFDSMDGKTEFASTAILVGTLALRKKQSDMCNKVIHLLRTTFCQGDHRQNEIVVDAFIQRLGRILSRILDEPIFTEKKNHKNGGSEEDTEVIVNDVYNMFPLEDLEYLEMFIGKWTQNDGFRQAASTGITALNEKEDILRKNLGFYIQWLKSVVLFIQKIGELSSENIRKVMDKGSDDGMIHRYRMSNASKDRLKERFDNEDSSTDFRSTIEDILYDFVKEYFYNVEDEKCGNEWGKKLCDQCGLIFNHGDKDVIEQMKPSKTNGGRTKLEDSVEKALEVFQKYVEGCNVDKKLRLDLDTICDVFKEKKKYSYIVDLVTKIVASRDPQQQGLQWINDGKNGNDKEGVDAYERALEYYKYAFCLLNIKEEYGVDDGAKEDPIKVLFSCDDQLFHYVLYKYLQKDGRLDDRKILAIKNNSLENFLQKEYPELLWKYYAEQGKYADAATHLMHNVYELEASLSERINWIRQAINIARGASLGDLVVDAELKLRTALIQQKLYTDEKRDGHLIDIQQLLSDSCENDRWDLVLDIFSFSAFADSSSKHKYIEQAWDNFISSLEGKSLPEAARQIETAMKMVEPGNDVLNPDTILPPLERFRMSCGGQVMWVLDTLLECGIPVQSLIDAYIRMVPGDERRCDDSHLGYIFCAAWLASRHGARIPRDDGRIAWFWRNVSDRQPYYEQALELKRCNF